MFTLQSGFAGNLQPILDAHVQGPYRFVHHALIPYLQLGPALEDVPVTITAGAGLRLHDAEVRELHGLDDTMIFVVMFPRQGQTQLMDIGFAPEKRALAERTIQSIGKGSKALTSQRDLRQARARLIETLNAIKGKAWDVIIQTG